jgi:para-aminobenzoate synthetase component I
MGGLWRVAEAEWPVDVPAAAGAWADGGELAWLDSAADSASVPQDARYSLIGIDPLAVLEQSGGRDATFAVRGRVVDRDRRGWRLWRRVQARLPSLPPMDSACSPGWVGYVGFEMARQLEALPASRGDDLGLPLMRLGLYDRAVLLDHVWRRAWAVAAQGVREALGLREGDAEAWRARWRHAAGLRRTASAGTAATVHHEREPEAYGQAVRRALEYIAAGDIYQVNLAQRLRITGLGDVLNTYARLRAANPAPHAALLRWDGGAVASLSPELFLQLRGDQVLTRPIKGTRPRIGDPLRDEVSRRELIASAKEAAELVMIVDLHRNDLSRVCRSGSVRVPQPRRVEAHPTVFHTVADVCGRLAPERDGLDLLAACFPAGSVTGVPKIRALQIIDELEPVARGVYTGAVGVLGLDGQMTFNVAIRTLQIRGATAALHVGGGIVADSDPAAEYAETLAKARGILGGLTAARAAGSAARAR